MLSDWDMHHSNVGSTCAVQGYHKAALYAPPKRQQLQRMHTWPRPIQGLLLSASAPPKKCASSGQSMAAVMASTYHRLPGKGRSRTPAPAVSALQARCEDSPQHDIATCGLATRASCMLCVANSMQGVGRQRSLE